jgi:hypothetical protein
VKVKANAKQTATISRTAENTRAENQLPHSIGPANW